MMYNPKFLWYNDFSLESEIEMEAFCMGFLVCIVGISIISAIVAAIVSAFTGGLIGAEEFDDED